MTERINEDVLESLERSLGKIRQAAMTTTERPL
jgi:hypothetical protein